MYRGCLPTEIVKNASGIAAHTIIRHVRGDSQWRPGGARAQHRRHHSHEGRPRQHAAEDDRQIEPERPRIVEPACGESFQVVADEEALEILGSMRGGHRHVPRRANREPHRNRAERGAGIESEVLPLEEPDRHQHNRRYQQSNRAFGEERAAGCGAGNKQPFGCMNIVVDGAGERGADGDRDEERQREVGQREPADREVSERGRHDRRRNHRRPRVEPASAPQQHHQREADASQRGPEARLRLADAGSGVGGRDQPVEKDGLLEARLVVVVRRQPVAALDHLACRFRVERFVRIADRRPSEAREEGDAAEEQEQQGRPLHGATIVYW